MKSLWYVSLLLLGFAGCVSIKPIDVTRDKGVMCDTLRVARYEAPLKSHLFKATLDIKKHHLTGLVVVKRMDTPPPAPPQTGRGDTPPPTPPQTGRGDTPPPAPPHLGRGEFAPTYRIVFVNEVGMTFFDLELKTDSLKVISCFGSLNKKALMKIFETDFRTLLYDVPLRGEKRYLQKGTKDLVISGRDGRYKIWQTFSPSGDTLLSISAKSSMADPVIISYINYNQGFPLKIVIENPFIGMKLWLRKMEQ